jgi:hypothetical protein
MATITAVLPPDLVTKINAAIDPDEEPGTAIECAIQITLPTATVSYSARGASVTLTMPDEELITTLLGVALLEQGSGHPAEAAVAVNSKQAVDAQQGYNSSTSPLL